VQQFELYWGEPAEAALSPPSVVGLLDPGDDRQAELLAGGPALPVQDVVLEQSEKRLHGGVVAGCSEPAHRPDQTVGV
jgi:hypothetical protein